MSILDLGIRRVTRRRAAATGDQAPGSAAWTGGASLATRACTVLLWSGVLCGPAALAVGGLALAGQLGGSVPALAAPASDSGGEQVAAGEFAERVVWTWLTTARGGEAKLQALVTSPSWSAPEKPYAVSNLSVAQLQSAGQIWSVVVAADVAADGQDPVRRYYQIPVVVNADAGGQPAAVSALTLPAPVAAPVVTTGAKLNYLWPVDGNVLLSQTVAQFLGAYLAGAGDVTRYVSPAAPVPVRAITPPAYTKVDVEEILADTQVDGVSSPAEGAQLRVLVDATAVTSGQQTSEVTYALTLRARAGRWEIFSIDPAPEPAPGLAAPASGATPAGQPPAAPSPGGTPDETAASG